MYGRFALLAAGAAIVIGLAACSGGGPAVQPLTVSLSSGADVLSTHVEGNWTATMTGGTAPYDVRWDFGGGSVSSILEMLDEPGPTSTASTAVLAGDWTATVQVTDAAGVVAIASRAYHVMPEPQLSASAIFAAGKITVVTDADPSADLRFNVDSPAGFLLGSPVPSLVNGNPGALVPVSAADPLLGANGELTVNITDSTGPTGVATVPVSLAPIALAADTLYAIPLQRQVRVGEPVTVLVATGTLPNPFLYMVGVGLTTDPDAQYDYGSLNFGDLGGAAPPPGQYWEPRFFPDGIWAEFAAQPGWSGFLLAPDGEDFSFSFYSWIENGRRRWDMNLTPLGVQPRLNASGALFNVAFNFDSPGVKTFGFQQVSGVKRTYYADDATEYFWGDISNDHPGVANSVEVLP
jgi:hypothetical protein